MSKVDSLLAHELQLQRVATELLRKGLYPSLDAAYKAIRAILLEAETITSPTKLKATERAINKAVNEALEKGWSEYTKELTNIAIYDASYYAQLIGAGAVTLKVPGKRSIADYVQSALMSLNDSGLPKAGVWAKFVKDNIDSFTEQVNNIVVSGYTNNRTVKQVEKDIMLFAGHYQKRTDGKKIWIHGKGSIRAEALARTGLQHYAQSAREAMIEDNLDIIDREYPIVTFDNRLSDTCRNIAVQYPNGWPVGKSPVGRPPYHFSCRTSLIVGIKGAGDPRVGVKRPALGSGENYESGDRYRGRKSTAAGEFKPEQVNANIGFGTWLRRQDPVFVQDVLGKTRAELFLNGGLPLDRMSDAYGRQLTLAELMEREKAAFKRAGLSG